MDGMDAPRHVSWWLVLRHTAAGWSRDQVSRLAASLAYYMIFSIAPLLLISVSVVGVFFGEQSAQGVVSAQLKGWLGADKARALQQILLTAQRPRIGSLAGLLGFAVLLLGAAGVVGELQASLNQIFGAQARPKGYWLTIRRRLVSFGFVLGMGGLVLFSLFMSAATAAADRWFNGALGLPPGSVSHFASFIVLLLLFAGMFRLLADAKIAWHDLCVGASATAALFTFGNLILGTYIGTKMPASAYGAAGSLLAFLMWTYYCAQIVYCGAEFTRSYADGRGSGIRPKRNPG